MNSIGINVFTKSKLLEIIEILQENTSYKSEESSLMSFDGKKLYYALQGDSNIINIPESVESIESGFFESLKSNSIINIGKNVKDIGTTETTSNIQSINVSEEKPNLASIDGNLYNKDLTTLIIYCSKKSVVNLPNTVKNIRGNAFRGNVSVQQVTLHEGIESIGTFAFDYTNITEIYLPNSLTNFSAQAFAGGNFSVATSEDNPNYTIVDETYILSKDQKTLVAVTKNLVTYNIPNTVETIGRRAFYAKYNCTEIKLPSSVKTIEAAAFDYSTNIQKIEIPSSIESIATNAFYRCNSLTQIIIDKKEGDISGAPWGCPYGLRAVIWNG